MCDSQSATNPGALDIHLAKRQPLGTWEEEEHDGAATTGHISTRRAARMPLSSPPVPSPARASSLPRRLSFSHDAAQLHFASAMKGVQQYIGAHLPGLPADQLALLGVNDARARFYFDEIQQFLAHHRGARAEQQQQEQRRPIHQTERRRRDSDLLLLQDIDAFLDELDPSLFLADAVTAACRINESATTTTTTQLMPSQSASRFKRSCSYIQEMQARAFACKKPRAALTTE